VAFAILTILTILTSAALLGLSLYIIYIMRGIEMGDFFKFPIILGPTLGSVATSVLVLLVAKLVKNYARTEQKNITLEHEKTENELKFLKSQLNPHFLFNALNNIYFLIKKDPDTAAESLAKFSDMVRYQLYDIADEMSDLKISPLILVPLVENAFKHVGENEEGENYIDLSIKHIDGKLACTTKNSIAETTQIQNDKSTTSIKKEGGLGLPNLKRRLSILYPDKHKLEIKETAGSYSSKLELDL